MSQDNNFPPLPELETRPLIVQQAPGTGKWIVNTPDNSTLILSTDDVSGGLRITQELEHGGAPLLSISPLGMGAVVINAREEL